MNWWTYYKLQNEPYLSPDALTTQRDLELFYGRAQDIEIVSTLTQGTSKKTWIEMKGESRVISKSK